MRKNGFTLIELLAVIVILAIILVIAVPQILGVIENSKKDSFVISTKYIIDGTKKIFSSHYDEIQSLDGKTFTIENNSFIGDSIPISGKLPENGIINLNPDGTIRVAFINNNWCTHKNEYEDDVIIEQLSEEDCLSKVQYTNDSCFTFDQNTKTITNYDLLNCPSNIIIPNRINNVVVENIAPGAFIDPLKQGCVDMGGNFSLVNTNYVHTEGDGYDFCYYDVNGGPIRSVIFPQKLKTIGYGAFDSNQISSVTLPNSVTSVGEYAFYNNQVISATLSNNMNVLDNSVFRSNQLTNITIPNSIREIKDFALGFNQLTNITIPNSVNKIGYYSFSGNVLQNIVIPNSVTYIEACAFCYNNLTSISIPSSVTTLENFVFNDNQLPDSDAFIYARNSNGTINNTKVISYGGSKRDNIIIPNNITTIGRYAFFGNSITSVTIPNTVKVIEQGAFSYNQLPSVTIPNGVTTIATEAFYDNKLTSILIPNSVTSIGSSAFRYNYIIQGNATIDRVTGSISIGGSAFANNGPAQATTITPVYLR